MIKVYVAGPYSDNNGIGVLKNIGRGEHEAAKLFALGYAPYCPWHDKDFIMKLPYGEWDVLKFQQFSMEWMRVSDVVYVVPNVIGLRKWTESRGTLTEIEEANRLGIPVVFSMEELEKRFPIKVDTSEFFG